MFLDVVYSVNSEDLPGIFLGIICELLYSHESSSYFLWSLCRDGGKEEGKETVLHSRRRYKNSVTHSLHLTLF